jgi:acylphosphatase
MTVLFAGQVQGVGFRYTAKTVATGFDITGTIRNLPDGRVELVAEGSRAELDAFRAALHAAGLAGFIRDEQVSWADAKNENLPVEYKCGQPNQNPNDLLHRPRGFEIIR